ncbi:MAG: hypothetical protein Q7J73_03280 [Dehalococcoidales bacterium]|nr:hypothetical protein [Dehalococcoidales bacterium]
MAGNNKKLSTAESKRDYTFSVMVSFTMQATFMGNEVCRAAEGGKNAVEPTEKALATLEDRLKVSLSREFIIDEITAWADSGQLLAILEIIEDDSALGIFPKSVPAKPLNGHNIKL